MVAESTRWLLRLRIWHTIRSMWIAIRPIFRPGWLFKRMCCKKIQLLFNLNSAGRLKVLWSMLWVNFLLPTSSLVSKLGTACSSPPEFEPEVLKWWYCLHIFFFPISFFSKMSFVSKEKSFWKKIWNGNKSSFWKTTYVHVYWHMYVYIHTITPNTYIYIHTNMSVKKTTVTSQNVWPRIDLNSVINSLIN